MRCQVYVPETVIAKKILRKSLRFKGIMGSITAEEALKYMQASTPHARARREGEGARVAGQCSAALPRC